MIVLSMLLSLALCVMWVIWTTSTSYFGIPQPFGWIFQLAGCVAIGVVVGVFVARQ